MARLRDRPELLSRDRLAGPVQTEIAKAFMAAVQRMRRSASLTNIERGALDELVDASMGPMDKVLRKAALAGGRLVDDEVNEVSE